MFLLPGGGFWHQNYPPHAEKSLCYREDEKGWETEQDGHWGGGCAEHEPSHQQSLF